MRAAPRRAAVLIVLLCAGYVAIMLASLLFNALHDEVPRSRADVYPIPALDEGDVLCIADAHARPREGIAERGHDAPSCLPAGYGVPAGHTLVLHLRPGGACDAVRLVGSWKVPDGMWDMRCFTARQAGVLAGDLRRGPDGVWTWAPG